MTVNINRRNFNVEILGLRLATQYLPLTTLEKAINIGANGRKADKCSNQMRQFCITSEFEGLIMSRLSAIWTKCKNFLSAHHQSTMLGLALGQSTREEWKEVQNKAFEQGRHLSVFIGMFTQLAFANLSFLYLGYLVTKSETLFEKFALIASTGCGLFLYSALLLKIFNIILAFYLIDTAPVKSIWGKIFLVLLALAQLCFAAYGINVLTNGILKSSSLIPLA